MDTPVFDRGATWVADTTITSPEVQAGRPYHETLHTLILGYKNANKIAAIFSELMAASCFLPAADVARWISGKRTIVANELDRLAQLAFVRAALERECITILSEGGFDATTGLRSATLGSSSPYPQTREN